MIQTPIPSLAPPPVLGLSLAALLLATTAVAETLDQAQLDGTGQSRAIHSDSTWGQTVTVGTSGFLTRIELSVAGTSAWPLRVEVFDASEEISEEHLLGLVEVSVGDLGPQPATLEAGEITATAIDVSPSAIAVEPGDRVWIRLSTNAPVGQHYSVRLSLDSESYPAGTLTGGDAPTAGDLAFQTFVGEVAIPAALDQRQLVGHDQGRAIHVGTVSLGQRFRAGRDGHLEALELILSAPPTDVPLRVEILREIPDAEPLSLGSVDLLPEDLGPAVRGLDVRQPVATLVDLSPLAIVVLAEDPMIVRLSTELALPSFYDTRISTRDVYPLGQLENAGTPTAGDLAFKTFVTDPVFADGFESGDASRWQ